MGTATTQKNLLQKWVEQFEGTSFDNKSERRNQAASALKALGFPSNKSEEYRFTPVTQKLEKEFADAHFFKETPGHVATLEPFQITGLTDHCIAMVNGKYEAALSNFKNQEGVVIAPLKDILSEQPDLLEKYAVDGLPADPFALMNTASWRDGLFIHIRENTKVDVPIVIHCLYDAKSEQVITHHKLVVIMDRNSHATIIEKHDSIGGHRVFVTANEDMIVDTEAKLNFHVLQNDKGEFYQVTNTTIRQQDNSHVNTHTITTDGKLIRNNLNILIDGEGCESHFYGLYLIKDKTIADNHTVVDHRKPNSFSNELYKGVMDDHAKGIFNGKIFVRPHAQKTNAFQSNRNILLTDNATVNTKPQLEIWADDVKCSHGCTTGQLDEEALFYLQSRGIPKSTAKAMLLYAFAGEIIQTIEDDSLVAHVDKIISERLHKDF